MIEISVDIRTHEESAFYFRLRELEGCEVRSERVFLEAGSEAARAFVHRILIDERGLSERHPRVLELLE